MPAILPQPARRFRGTPSLRLRPRSPAPMRPTPPHPATHDFLVANPRPDLTTDAKTLLMLARD